MDAYLDVPIVAREHPAPTFSVDPPKRHRKNVQPRSPDGPTTEPFAPEPGVTDEGFAEILATIRSVTRAVERYPSTFAGMPEESLRDVLLVVLNNQFGPATGETFSRNGKTDILISYGDTGEAVFIAECRWWRGPSKFRSAIDQVLSYLVWRDTKAALVLFIGQPDVSLSFGRRGPKWRVMLNTRGPERSSSPTRRLDSFFTIRAIGPVSCSLRWCPCRSGPRAGTMD